MSILATGFFQGLDFLFQHRRHPMPREIDLTDADSQLVGDLLRRPFFADVTVENLKLFMIDLFLRARDCRLKQILSPFCFPYRVKIDNVRIRYALDRRGETIVRGVWTFHVSRFPFAKLIDDSPARDLQEPAFEGAD